MKKILTLLPLVAVLAACGTTDPYGKRADMERERQEKLVERAIDKAPKWMYELPSSTSAVYEAGTGRSTDFSYADMLAKDDAYRKICMTAGGTMSMRNKVYRSEGENSATSINEEIKQWMADHPGQTPPASKIMEWRAKAPQNPTVQSLAEQQKMTMDQQAQALQTAKSLYDASQITKEEYGRRVRSIEQSQAPSGATISSAPSVTVPEPKAEPKPSKIERPTYKDGALQFYAKDEDDARRMYKEEGYVQEDVITDDVRECLMQIGLTYNETAYVY